MGSPTPATPIKTGRIAAPLESSDTPEEPPSPMSHAKILARHATFAPRTEEEKAFGSPIPQSPDGSNPTSPRPNGKGKKGNAAPRRKFSFPKMGFFTRGAKHRDAPTPAAPRAAPRGGPRRAKQPPLLEPRDPSDQRITLVLDLDETLVRSSFDVSFDADFEAPFALNGAWCTARVRKRPHVDEFLARVAKHFELVVMTAGVMPYAKLVLDMLDSRGVLRTRFYRESCTKTASGLLVKDLARMNRDLKRTIIVDNSPNAYLWHPEHAIDVCDFVGDPADDELKAVGAFLEKIRDVDDVRRHVAHWRSGADYALPAGSCEGAAARAEAAKEAAGRKASAAS
mmetsp:Transcript_29318/g.87696  ORF Transcript_29318/g.87696 Transcript_29318/m.87696 type:complete len:340 (-) Transcript_29318:475-1494(-)